MKRITIIGAGSWGTAFAGVCSANVESVSLWCHSLSTSNAVKLTRKNSRYLPDYTLPKNIVPTTELAEALDVCDVCVFAVPSTYLREICHTAARYIPSTLPICVLTKGIEPKTGMLMTELVASELNNPDRLSALSGPNHAEEICRMMPSSAVLASDNISLAKDLQSTFTSNIFRVYVSEDLRGVEICGAYKNIIAIACGMSVASGGGDNTLALLMTRGVAEIGRVVSAYGGDPMTCMGLAGMGDLVATCTSLHSRNRRFGEAFASGVSLNEFEASTHMVVEGAYAAASVQELGKKLGVETPIADAVFQLLQGETSLSTTISSLLERVPTQEFYGMNNKTDVVL